MGKIMTASLAAAFLVLAEASASAASGFSLSSLKGPYVFQVHGFEASVPTSNTRGDIGEIAALGLLTFDGAGHVSGNVNFTGADNNSSQGTCQGSLSTASNYTVSADGTGGLTLAFTVASNCVTSGDSSEAKLVFNLILNNNGAPSPSAETATSASLLFSLFVPSLGPFIAGLAPVSLVLEGGLRRQGDIGLGLSRPR